VEKVEKIEKKEEEKRKNSKRSNSVTSVNWHGVKKIGIDVSPRKKNRPGDELHLSERNCFGDELVHKDSNDGGDNPSPRVKRVAINVGDPDPLSSNHLFFKGGATTTTKRDPAKGFLALRMKQETSDDGEKSVQGGEQNEREERGERGERGEGRDGGER